MPREITSASTVPLRLTRGLGAGETTFTVDHALFSRPDETSLIKERQRRHLGVVDLWNV